MSKKKVFKLPYIGIETDDDELHVLLGTRGEPSAVLKIVNPVLQYCADPEEYIKFHQNLLNVIKILGEGYLVQKLDVFSKGSYQGQTSEEYLQQKFAEHFKGRVYTVISTYLVITKPGGKKTAFPKKGSDDFKEVIFKLKQALDTNGFKPQLLGQREIDLLVLRILTMDFMSKNIVLDNMVPSDTDIRIGERQVRCLSLIDIDRIDLPEKISPYIRRSNNEAMKDFPVDVMAFLHHVPDYDTIIYNQVIEIPKQTSTIQKLQVKQKRHSGIPDPENDICVADIEKLLEDVARENQLLVNAHFSLLVCAGEKELPKTINYIENALFLQGIIPSRNSYNQLELFRSALPGNGVELKNYDLYLTTSDAALSFLFKEALPVSEPAPKGFSVCFTDRQGIPIKIDPADYSWDTGRINNRNKFVLGPSGSGKSFFMNALIEQYLLYNMDVVIVDTGDSYAGTSAYLNGRYITYKPEKPITMNPFVITRDEYNLEKKDFLTTLIGLLWKGADGKLSQLEADVISDVVIAFYRNHFHAKENRRIEKASVHEPKDRPESSGTYYFKVDSLNFNMFYEFAIHLIPLICKKDEIEFDFPSFRYVLKKFYKGGEFESILNEEADSSLFGERLIVFEIDNIKENKTLFPIVTLIVMDIFLQKMRFRQGQRKALIIEEAWKAIASPMMAGYILYLYKTVRKFNGEAIVVTQELDDIIGNAVVKDSIINNSDTVCLLDQSKFRDNYQSVERLLSINEVEKRKIFTVNNLDNKTNRGPFKEVYIRRGSTGEVYGVEVSLCQYLTYTTEKPEKLAVQTYISSFGNYPDGLEKFVGHMKKCGLPVSKFVLLVNIAGQVLTDQMFEVLSFYQEQHGTNVVIRLQKDFQASGLEFSQWIGRQNKAISG
ncbi:helicase HerA domain-containing protein [Gaoshiqia sp. Z1-71]|uniref:TraG/VirB4 family ATPase n=1 Tax=Gaoshiqia hydrogeniformans TaxID=3290090 RepID=UPI003BF8FAC2